MGETALNKRALAGRLAKVYLQGLAGGGITRVDLARLCDEVIDPSGELLGLVREEVWGMRVEIRRPSNDTA